MIVAALWRPPDGTCAAGAASNQTRIATDVKVSDGLLQAMLALDNHARYFRKCGCAGQPSDYATLPEVRRTTPG